MEEKRKVRKLRNSKWVRAIFEGRNTKGEYKLLIKELQVLDHEYFLSTFARVKRDMKNCLDWLVLTSQNLLFDGRQ